MPPVNTSAKGNATFELSDDGTKLHYKIMVENIENVTQAHIHLAPSGIDGPVVAWLYPDVPPAVLIPGRFDGLLAQGNITSINLTGPLAGQTLNALLEAMMKGNIYVNVHTNKYQAGEIRGQIKPEAPIPFAVNINISGIPVLGSATSNILNIEYTNFSSGDPYNISITAPNGSRVYYDSGTLAGTNPQIIPVTWTPSSIGNHTIEAWGRGMIDRTPVVVYDIKVVSPVPELETIVLVAVGMLGLIGIRRRY